MHLAFQACHWTEEINISNKSDIVKNPNCQEAHQLAIYKAWPRIWTQDYQETNPASGRVEALNLEPPDYNTSALNHSATLLPRLVSTRTSVAKISLCLMGHVGFIVVKCTIAAVSPWEDW